MESQVPQAEGQEWLLQSPSPASPGPGLVSRVSEAFSSYISFTLSKGMGTRLPVDHSPLIAALLQCQSWVDGLETPKIPQGFYEASGMASPRAEGCRPECRETLSSDDNLFCPCCPFAVMMEILPRRCVPIAKKEILYMGTFGLACWLSGVIFIDRKRREESIGTLTEVAHSLHKDNVSGEESDGEPLENRNLDVGGKRSLSLGWAPSRTE